MENDENIVTSIADGQYYVTLMVQNKAELFQPALAISDIDLTVDHKYIDGTEANADYGG